MIALVVVVPFLVYAFVWLLVAAYVVFSVMLALLASIPLAIVGFVRGWRESARQ